LLLIGGFDDQGIAFDNFNDLCGVKGFSEGVGGQADADTDDYACAQI
jgi:hypothetical protein